MESDGFGIRYRMRKKRKHLHAILKAAELPQDLDPHLLAVHWIGGELLIEQHRGILRFEANEIRFASEQGTLTVCGDGLEMERLSETSALICGGVRSVSLEEKS